MRGYARALLTLILASLLLPLNVSSADSLKIYATVDCYITNWSPNANSHGEVLKVMRGKVRDRYNESRAIMSFDLAELARVPQGSKVEEASLIIKVINHSNIKVEVWELAKEPDILSVSWLMASSGKEWLTPGGDLLRKVGEAKTSSGELKIDIRDYIQALVNAETNTSGWFILRIAEGEEGYLHFYSELSANKPRIEVSYRPASLELALESSEVKVSQGSSTLLKVYINGYLGSAVYLRVKAPDFLNFTISPEQGYPSFVSTLNLTVPEYAPGGAYAVTIVAVGALNRSVTLKLTVLERRGFAVTGPKEVKLRGGFTEVLKLRVFPTGNFSGEVAASLLEAPDWLNVRLDPSKGRPPFNLTMVLKPLPEINASGKVKILLKGQFSRSYEVTLNVRARKVAIYSNEIDWSLSKELIKSYSNASGLVVRRVSNNSLFPSYDLIIVLGGHKAPTDNYMPTNIASKFLNGTERDSLEKGGSLVAVKIEGETFIVIVAGKTRKETATLLSSDPDADGLPLIAELITEDPRELVRP
ncbi:MAG: DNRLRE domain-containing protein [Candidatus Korarchaeum sp.]|nr:DNRLRE domain-containing protein [Candidatus Korarchaeum sp.]